MPIHIITALLEGVVTGKPLLIEQQHTNLIYSSLYHRTASFSNQDNKEQKTDLGHLMLKTKDQRMVGVKKRTLVMFLDDRRALVVMEADMVKVYEKICSLY